MKTVLILSGISGSGKTTYANKLQALNPGSIIVSADHYFTKADGTYAFDVKQLGEAHASCYRAFKAALAENVELIVVDNTNTTERERKGYVTLAKEAGYDVQTVMFPCDPAVAVARNVHNVPEAVIKSQFERLQKQDNSVWNLIYRAQEK